MEVQNLRVAAIKEFSDKPVVTATENPPENRRENTRRPREDRRRRNEPKNDP
jgi:hypothetical protein